MECALVNKQDFLEVISTWNSIYASNHMAYEILKKHHEDEAKWKNGLLKVASALDVIEDIKGTPIELLLNKAIRCAKTYDVSKLQEVHELLHTVEKFMYEDEV
jgi:pyrrolidone-carboxylate peptidase